ncbi:diacylglycerol/lipid kinase family protein [Flavobacterium cellulosilyticum]|uniref:Diacylglycerol kinase n=1 Tax=Flavobacterium cellulosilyticum TaxID=2541731 RepID=A0A4R5C487_9FLAO|nr:diacylglycerol kinase family protein [Flavobacterium cellulosilyticum]TDD93765.1 diacylglycerol kinase [Flavobacterium cellulosilyticum]
MKKKFLIVVNPVSGGIDKTSFIDVVSDFASNENINIIVYETTMIKDISKIRMLYLKHLPERIIVLGGDGTIKMVAEAIEKYDVILGIVPVGSSNGLAVDLDLMKSLEENLYIAFYNDFIALDTIVLNDQKCFHLSDLGINAELVKNYEKSNLRGKWGYFIQAINTLLDLGDPFTAKITVNGKTIESEARMIVIANSQKYGTGVVINPNGIMNDGLFELVILKRLDLMIFGEIIMGNMTLMPDKIEIISTNKAVITTNYPVSFQIDGEYCDLVTKLEISISPYKIKVAIP